MADHSFPRCAGRLASLLVLAAGSLTAAAATLELDAAAQARLGLKTVALQPMSGSESLDAVATVLDATPLIRLNGDLATAEATSSASAAEAARSQLLQQAEGNISLKAVEAARAQAAVDANKLSAMRAELRANWGGAVAAMNAAARMQWIDALARGDAALLRIDSLGAMMGKTPTRAWLTLPDRTQRSVDVMGVLPQAASGLSPALLARASGAGLAPGMALTARVATAQRTSGLLLPRGAVIRWNGLQYAYVAIDDGHFERRAVSDAQVIPEGWRVSQGFNAGDKVVVQGAAALLGAETLAPAEEETADAKKDEPKKAGDKD